MKKLFTMICAGVCAGAMMLSFTGCGSKSDEKDLIGTWKYDSSESDVRTDAEKLTFYEGGACANTGESGTWSVSGDTLTVYGTYGGQFFSHDNLIGTFEVDGDKLIITDPAVDGNVKSGELVYNKKEK